MHRSGETVFPSIIGVKQNLKDVRSKDTWTKRRGREVGLAGMGGGVGRKCRQL